MSPTTLALLVLLLPLASAAIIALFLRRSGTLAQTVSVAATLALVAFSRFNGTIEGNVFVFFILTVAAAEVAVGLAIVVALFRKRGTVDVSKLNALKN